MCSKKMAWVTRYVCILNGILKPSGLGCVAQFNSVVQCRRQLLLLLPAESAAAERTWWFNRCRWRPVCSSRVIHQQVPVVDAMGVSGLHVLHQHQQRQPQSATSNTPMHVFLGMRIVVIIIADMQLDVPAVQAAGFSRWGSPPPSIARDPLPAAEAQHVASFPGKALPAWLCATRLHCP